MEELKKHGFKQEVKQILLDQGIKELNPVQKQALETNFLEEKKNLVIASPTGSGKTLVAELAALKNLEKNKKTAYTCPLRSLAHEQHKNFQKYKKIGLKPGLSLGNLDSKDSWLKKKNAIFCSNEKLDSLMRHKTKWIPDIKLLIVDEVHLLDSDRGPTLEVLVTRFQQLFQDVQILALSATIPNAEEIADWLDSELVSSDWRPTKLVEGVYFNGTIKTTEGTRKIQSNQSSPTMQLIEDSLKENEQTAVFTSTRRSAESTAKKVAGLSNPKNKGKLNKIAEKVLSALEQPTKQCKKLADCIRKGSAFHHAGLVHEQKTIVEKAFKERELSTIAATPTVAMGVNLPAERAVHKSMTRYTSAGIKEIPVREYKQKSGRIARPQYNDEGEAIIAVKNKNKKKKYWDKYVKGTPEPVDSQLALEPVLRTQLLASIAARFVGTEEGLEEFLMSSFHAHQYGESRVLKNKVDRILNELDEKGFVEKTDGKLVATELGKRTSELYLDPYSSHSMLEAFQERDFKVLGLLYALVDTEEMKPYLRVRKGEEDDLWSEAHSRDNELGFDVVSIGFEEYQFLKKFKTAKLMEAWISEKTDEEILEEFNVKPGTLRGIMSNAEWMAYSAKELCKVRELDFSGLKKLRRRIKHGIKSELLPLAELKGIGRVRARKLFENQVKTVNGLKKTNSKDLARILGGKLAAKIKKQLGQEVDEKELEKVRKTDQPQTTLQNW